MTDLRGAKYRHEIKYQLSFAEAAVLRSRISLFMKKDSHVNNGGYYTVRSLYFDDLNNSAYTEKMNGVPSRQKYRIRTYEGSDSVIMLERKIKEGSYVYKQSARLTRAQVGLIQNGQTLFLAKAPEPLFNILYFEMATRLLRPKLIVEYEREPFVYSAGDVRITFDTDIRACLASNDLFAASSPMVSALSPGRLVMEVKYTQFLPTLIRDLLPDHSADLLAVSKYVACCDAANYKQ